MKNTFDVKHYIKNEYSHKYQETWESLNLFCPNCGQQNVWHDTGEGDYYVGENYMCAACGSGWCMPGGVYAEEKNNQQGRQRFEAIQLNPCQKPEQGR